MSFPGSPSQPLGATERQPERRDPYIAALVLAAGSSRRFGSENKLLALLDGKPVIRWTAEALADSRAADIVIVAGPDSDLVQAALDGLRVRIAHNPRHDEGMGQSLAAGVASLGPNVDGVLVCLADMPLVPASLIDGLIARFHEEGSTRIVLPAGDDGRYGHPVLWPKLCFSELAGLSGDQGGKALLDRYAGLVVALPTASLGAFADVDTPADLARYGSALRK